MKTIEEIEESFKTEEWCDILSNLKCKIAKDERIKEMLKKYVEKYKDDKEHMSKMIFMLGFMKCQEYFSKNIPKYIVECQQSFVKQGFELCAEEFQKMQDAYLKQENDKKNIEKDGNVINIKFKNESEEK